MLRRIQSIGIRGVLLLCVLLFVPSVTAQNAIHVTTASYHVDRTPGGGTEVPNEFNPGLGLEWPWGRGGIYVGGFYNSVRHVSLYTGYGRTAFPNRPVRVGAVMGVVTGYPIFEVAPDLTVLPGVIPYLEAGSGRISPRLYVVPFRGGVVAAQVRIRIR